jgi:dTDP-4-dehydrorhamnose 3,5-epimerase
MKFVETSLAGIIRIEPTVHRDGRGYFMETWQSRRFADHGISAEFVQDNVSSSCRGTLRGLHYQIEQAQGKLIRVVQGEVYDLAVDLRKSSPQYGQWVGEILSAENKHQLWIPPGFGHGFLVLSETAEFAYKCTDYYAPEFERSIRWDDPDLDIEWPLVDGKQPMLSARDADAPLFKDAETYA